MAEPLLLITIMINYGYVEPETAELFYFDWFMTGTCWIKNVIFKTNFQTSTSHEPIKIKNVFDYLEFYFYYSFTCILYGGKVGRWECGKWEGGKWEGE